MANVGVESDEKDSPIVFMSFVLRRPNLSLPQSLHLYHGCPCTVVSASRRSSLAAAAGRSGLNTLALSDLNCGLVVDGGGSHAFLDLAGHGQKGLFDVGGVLGRGLEEWDPQAVGKFLFATK